MHAADKLGGTKGILIKTMVSKRDVKLGTFSFSPSFCLMCPENIFLTAEHQKIVITQVSLLRQYLALILGPSSGTSFNDNYNRVHGI